MTWPDPGSVSALGGVLRTQALRLADHEDRLEVTARRAVRYGAVDPTLAERALLRETAVELDRIGAALQAWTADTTEDSARLRVLAHEAARSELRVEGHLVVETPAPSRVDPTVRLRETARLQERLNRLTASRTRGLGRLRRELESSAVALQRLTTRARTASWGADPATGRPRVLDEVE
ncbi:MAG: hypothetical protein ABIS35_03975 [Terracoccus sp.]